MAEQLRIEGLIERKQSEDEKFMLERTSQLVTNDIRLYCAGKRHMKRMDHFIAEFVRSKKFSFESDGEVKTFLLHQAVRTNKADGFFCFSVLDKSDRPMYKESFRIPYLYEQYLSGRLKVIL